MLRATCSLSQKPCSGSATSRAAAATGIGPGFGSLQQASAHEPAAVVLPRLASEPEQQPSARTPLPPSSLGLLLAVPQPLSPRCRDFAPETRVLAPDAHDLTGEDVEQRELAGERFLSTDDRSRGAQQDSCPRASSARQRQPRASSFAWYNSCVARDRLRRRSRPSPRWGAVSAPVIWCQALIWLHRNEASDGDTSTRGHALTRYRFTRHKPVNTR